MTIRHNITIACDEPGCPEWTAATCEIHDGRPARIRGADGWCANGFSRCPSHNEERRKKSREEADARIVAILKSVDEKRAVKP